MAELKIEKQLRLVRVGRRSDPEQPQWKFWLQPGTTWLGRNPDVGIMVGTPYSSRLHCQFEVCDNRALVTDKWTTNGTFVNGSRLAPGVPRLLKSGDVIGIGTEYTDEATLDASPSLLVFRVRREAMSASEPMEVSDDEDDADSGITCVVDSSDDEEENEKKVEASVSVKSEVDASGDDAEEARVEAFVSVKSEVDASGDDAEEAMGAQRPVSVKRQATSDAEEEELEPKKIKMEILVPEAFICLDSDNEDMDDA